MAKIDHIARGNVVRADPSIFEHVTTAAGVLGADHSVDLDGRGIANGVYCDTAGEILKVDMPGVTGYTTLALQAGFNPMAVTKIYSIANGSVIAGSVDVYATNE